MRKAIAWLMIALMALQCAAFAEIAPASASQAVNSMDAVRTASDVYFAIPDGEGEMLVRVPLNGGDPVCVDRADDIEDLLPYGGGVAYLKTTGGSSAITNCVGNEVSTIYGFGAAQATGLSAYSGKLLVITDGLLHSIEPASQVCLKLSGAQMLDYVLGDGCAYFLSGGDRMEYTATLDSGDVTKQAGCVYRLDLNSGETTLLLKSGGEDLKLRDHNLYFHNLADAYAVRIGDVTELRGRVYSLDVQLKTLSGECTEPDSGFWPMDKGLVSWYGGALNLESEAGTLALYNPENGALVVSDGNFLYVWEVVKQTLSQVSTTGEVKVLYTGDLSKAVDAADLIPDPTATPTVEPTTTPASDKDDSGNAAWFDEFMDNKETVSGGSSSGGSTSPKATPIGATPTPVPAATRAPSLGSVGSTGTADDTASSGSTGSGSSSSGSSSSGSSSGSNQSSGKTYSVDVSYLKVTGGRVNVRSKAGMNGSILGTVTKGTVLSCTGKASKDSSGLVWYQVKANGNTGWISSKLVSKTSKPSSSSSSGNQSGPVVNMSGDYVKIVGGSVTLRAKPDKNSSRLGTISEGKTVTFLGKASTDSRGVVWFKVKSGGTTGWVSSKYAQITNSQGNSSGGSTSSSGSKVKIVGGDVTIRSKPNKTSSKLGYIAEGKKATYLGESSTDSRGIKWYKVKYNGVTGWVSSMYSKLVS